MALFQADCDGSSPHLHVLNWKMIKMAKTKTLDAFWHLGKAMKHTFRFLDPVEFWLQPSIFSGTITTELIAI